MEHTEATAMKATERYLLGELTEAETDAFEAHYFDCAECTDDVRAGMLFMEGGRRLVRESAEPVAAPVVQIAEHRARRWPLWMSNAAAAVMAFALAGTLLLRGPAAPGPQMAIADEIALGDVRAAEAKVVTLPGIVSVDILQPDPPFSRYEVRVLGPDGKVAMTDSVSAERANDSLALVIEKGFAPGLYRVEISGVNPAGSHQRFQTEQFTVKR
jgi:Putative zinc-finger